MARLTDKERLAWLRLIRTENIGPRTFHHLLDHFGSAEAAILAWPDLVKKGGGSGKRLCDADTAERELAGLQKLGAKLIALGEPDYPEVLAESDGAPPLLTALGDIACLSRPTIAIVGARNASAAGRSFAAKLAAGLGASGFTIASGLARGIDTAAHEASLMTGTIAVLAGGPDRIYPAENATLLERITAQGGAAVTEMPLGWEPRAKDFPRRNRIIAGLARGVVIVEAALRSGSLITARLANEMGREVMAAPGSPLDIRCEGSNGLLREGATLITSAEHVIEALGPSLAGQRPPQANRRGPIIIKEEKAPAPAADDGLRARVLELLGPSPAGVDDIVRLSGAPARTVQLVLLELEMAGRLERHLGGRISLIAGPAY